MRLGDGFHSMVRSDRKHRVAGVLDLSDITALFVSRRQPYLMSNTSTSVLTP